MMGNMMGYGLDPFHTLFLALGQSGAILNLVKIRSHIPGRLDGWPRDRTTVHALDEATD